MNTIELQQTLPAVFAGRDSIISDVWHQSLTLKRGEAYLVEAASGTGKSSLCSYIYGYRNDYQGIICFDGKNIRTLSVRDWVEIRKCSISMLFQELRLFTELTAWENVQLKNSLTGFKSKKEIKAWFEQFGIADKWDTPIAKMSFGQQQRVALVRALCQPFDFIFLDEPISHLDEENGRIMSRILVEEADRQGLVGRYLLIASGAHVTSYIGDVVDVPRQYEGFVAVYHEGKGVGAEADLPFE